MNMWQTSKAWNGHVIDENRAYLMQSVIIKYLGVNIVNEQAKMK